MTSSNPTPGSILSMIPASGSVTFTSGRKTWAFDVVALAVVAGGTSWEYDETDPERHGGWLNDSRAEPVILAHGKPVSISQYTSGWISEFRWEWRP